MASRHGSRKRQRVASSIDLTTGDESANTTPRYLTTPTTAMPPPPNPPAAEHELALKSLTTDIEAMRSLLTCQVCNRLLYEPYSLSCGHAYCYSCLTQWMGNHHKKTCPDCRAHITQQPTPAYLIRELVLIFINRTQLLPPGETVEEHQQLAQEEAKIIADDRANLSPNVGGLFRGIFTKDGRRQGPIHDPGDGVYRCPDCHWELEDGYCGQCRRDIELDELDWTEDEDDDLDTDQELDALDREAFGAEGDEFDEDYYGDSDAAPGARPGGIPAPQYHGPYLSSDHGDTDEEDLDADGNLGDFVVNDDDAEDDGVTSDDGEDTDVPQGTHTRRLANRRGPPIVISDDEEDDGEDDDTARSLATHQDSVEYDSEDGPPPVYPIGQRSGRGHVPIPQRSAVMDSEDESESDASPLIYQGHNGIARPYYDPTADNDNLDDEHDDDDHDDDSELESTIHGGFSPLAGALEGTSTDRSDYESDEASTPAAYGVYEEDDLEDEDEVSDSEDDGWGTRDSTPRAQPNYTAIAATYPINTGNAPRGLYGIPGPSLMNFSGPYTMPAHPFNLENTLRSANYNQRNLHPRLYTTGGLENISRSANARKRQLSIASDDSGYSFR